MRMRPLLAGAAGLAAIVATAAPASAVKYGEPDAGEHPYVGLMVAYQWNDKNGDGERTDDELAAAWRCTGTQMDADTFLTAGHCTWEADAVAIWFDDDLLDVQTAREFVTLEEAKASGELRPDAFSYDAFSHPEYDDSAFYLHDVGVVDEVKWLSEELTEFGTLPEENYWDGQIAAKKKDRDSYTTVGYGLQWAMPDRGKSAPEDSNRRLDQAQWLKLKAGGELIGYRNFGAGKANDAYVVLTNNANTGGTCFGDSGGPTFIEGTTTVVAVTSFGMNSTCAGTSGVYRIDTEDDLEWLAGYIS